MDLPVNYKETPPWVRRLAREEYIKAQEGRCHHCGALLADEPHQDISRKPVDKSLFPTGFF